MGYSSKFIRAGADYSDLSHSVPAPLMRKSFEIKETVRSAKLTVCGLGFYELFVNGIHATKGYMAPYRSNPEQILYYDSYELSGMLKEGKNVLGFILGNGEKNAVGAFIWSFQNASYRGAPQLAFELELTYDGGESEVISADRDVLTAPSAILFDDLHFGEYYDARLEIPGWSMPEFDDSDWKHCEAAPEPSGEKRLCEAEPIIVREKLKPVSVTEQDGGYLYDFGVNYAGLYQLKINGFEGQKLLLVFGELLVDGKFYNRNIRFSTEDRYQEDEYTCRAGEQSYTPHFTYHGFRYILVKGLRPEQATPELLTYFVMSSDIKQIGDFRCDSEVVNKIQAATMRSDLSNFYYFPTDCPQREKNGWTADAALSSEQLLLNFTPEKSYAEWMRCIYKTLTDKGQLPGIIPTAGWGYEWGNGPAWDNVIIYIPYFIYKYRGNRAILEELSAPLLRYLDYLYSRLDENDLIAIGLGDWCPPSKDPNDFTAPLVLTDSILTADIAEKAAFVFDVLGKQPQKEFALTLEARVKEAIRQNLIDFDTMTAKGACQTSQAMALYYGVFKDDEKTRAFARLLDFVDASAGHIDTGVLGGKVIFRVLADFGHADLAYEIITRPDYPSYGNWIARGATTLWESFQPEGGQILSYNHHFWGDVSAWFYIYPAGIRVNPTAKDITNVDIKPCFIEKLSGVKAEHCMPDGRIAVEWHRNQSAVELTVSAAKELHGVIALPDGYTFADGAAEKPLASGNYKITKK